MFKSLQMWYHLWVKGHSIIIDRYHTVLSEQGGKGWYVKCECGKRWAR